MIIFYILCLLNFNKINTGLLPIYNYIKGLIFWLIVFNLRAVKREIKVSGQPTEEKYCIFAMEEEKRIISLTH